MIGFLNESSLEEYTDLQAALVLFLSASEALKEAGVAAFRDSWFFQTAWFKGHFNAIGIPKDVRAAVQFLVFTDHHFPCWRPDRLSNAEVEFHCESPTVTLSDVSLCEAAGRKYRDATEAVVVVSAADSAFGAEGLLRVYMSESEIPAELRNSTTLAKLREWIAGQREYYDRTSAEVPRDFQTVLEKDPTRFRRTGKRERRSKRQIFEEVTTGRLYYVDSLHYGRAAHIEVWSRTLEHLGIADLETGTLDESERVPERVLRW